MLFIQTPFLLCSFFSHILQQNYFTSFTPGCLFVLVHCPLIRWWNILLLFSNILFFPYCLILFLVIFWAFLLLPISFDSSLQVVLSDLSGVLFWSFHPNISFFFFFLGCFACCRNSFSCSFILISRPGFFIFIWAPCGNSDFITNLFGSCIMSRFISVPTGIFINILSIFSVSTKIFF